MIYDFPPPLEMCTYFMDGLFSEDKYWVTSMDYEPMKAKSLIICSPNSNPNPRHLGCGYKGLKSVQVMVRLHIFISGKNVVIFAER